MDQFCNTYKELSQFHGNRLRGYLRHLTLDVFTLGQSFVYSNLAEKPRIQFLYFHHVYPDEVSRFENLVSKLANQYTFISHSEAVNRLISGNVDKPYISWSSDDGLQNNMKAAEILQRYGASCCFYINPNSIGLQDPNKITEFCNHKLNMPATAFLNWQEVGVLLNNGHEIGSHTMGHDRVTTLSADEFEQDLHRSKEIIEQYCGSIAHFAYPYGRYTDFNKRAFKQVFDAGYQSCATAVRGCHIVKKEGVPENQLFIRRDLVIGAWPYRHMRYFINKSSQNATLALNYLPENY